MPILKDVLWNAFEDYVYRPLFFAIVLPPLAVHNWWQRQKDKERKFMEDLNKPLRSENETE